MNKKTLILCECAIMVALAVVFDLLSKFISGFFPNPWVYGGGVTIALLPIVFISYRHGLLWGVFCGAVYSAIQMISGLYLPATPLAIVLCVLLDYVLAFTVIGTADYFKKFAKRKLFGYALGAFIVCILRFVCSFLSGAILWSEYIAWESFTNAWLYSFVYNISYMLPTAIITALLIVAICRSIDPKTLKPYSGK